MRARFDFGSSVVDIDDARSLGAYPWLVGIGSVAITARAGHLDGIGATEAPNLSITISNDRGQAVDLLGRPLRVPVEVFDDDGESYFAGAVSTIDYGPMLGLTIEA